MAQTDTPRCVSYPDVFPAHKRNMIIGLGVDMEEISRVGEAIKRHGRAFLERIFTAEEIAYCERHRDAVERYAARFAAKEATMKALGTGWGKGVRWRDIEVARQPGSRPTIVLHGAARQHAERMGARHISLSISHTGNFALAQVILED